ncbi:MAG TPA: hypothetical protein VH682_17225 [Gemmataceae bacterium]|jgi:hypothetical protein
MSQDVKIQVVLRSFASNTLQGSVTVMDEKSQPIVVAQSGGVPQISLPIPFQSRLLLMTAQGSDQYGPLFPRGVTLELTPASVRVIPVTGLADPEPPIRVTLNPSLDGPTVVLEIFLARLREKTLSGYTGTEALTGTFVNPASVDSPPSTNWKLTPAAPADLKVRKLLLEAPANFVPAWYAVAFEESLKDFRDLLVYFAPQPPLREKADWDAAGYPDAYSEHVKQYVTRHPTERLARYAHKQLAFQVAQSRKKVVFVYPVIKFYSAQLGALKEVPQALFREIVHYLQRRFASGAATIPSQGFNRIAVASFSFGASNLTAFLKAATGDVRSAIQEVYDFDSDFLLQKSVPAKLVGAVGAMAGVVFRRYLQTQVAFGSLKWRLLLAANKYPLPQARWEGIPAVYPDLALHQDIANHMLTHALARSSFS